MKQIKLSRGIYILPSLFTTGSMFCGFFSIVRSINGDYLIAAWAIFVASFFDLIDGRVARMTRTQSEFGKEYDSLVDLASFGLAPAILVYTWTLSHYRPLGWFFSFLYFACVALRLARFNVQVENIEKRSFQGLPCPPAACLLASLVMFYHGFVGNLVVNSDIALVIVPAIAVLMVSNIRYRSFKEYDMQKSNSLYILLGACALVGIVAIKPEMVLFVLFSVYVVSGPLGALLTMKKVRQARHHTSKVKSTTRKLAMVDHQKNTVSPLKKSESELL